MKTDMTTTTQPTEVTVDNYPTIHASANCNPIGDRISIVEVELVKVTEKQVRVKVRMLMAKQSNWPTFTLDREVLESGETMRRPYSVMVRKGISYGSMDFSLNQAAASTAAHLGRDWETAQLAIEKDPLRYALDTFRGLRGAGAVIPEDDALRVYVRALQDVLDGIPCETVGQ